MQQGAKPPKVGARAAVSRKRHGSKSPDFERRLAEALERERAIDEILRIMSSSPGDVQVVLDAVAERTSRLCEAPFVRVLLVEGDTLRAVAAYSLDGSPPARSIPVALKQTSIVGRAVLDRATVHHDDVVPLLASEYPDAINARRLGLRAVLAVPLMHEGDAYGAILLFRREPGFFSPEQVALVESFARQAAIAIANTRLFKETKERLEQQTATGEILRMIASSQGNVEPLLSAVVERAMKLCEATGANIFLVEGDKLRAGPRFGITDGAVEFGDSMPLTRGWVTGCAVIDHVAVHVEDLALVPAEEFPISRDVQRRLGHHAVLSIPLLREDRAIGALALWRMEARPFTERQIALVKTFADQAAIAIENARLFNETKEALERQTATSDILRVISQSPRDVQPVFDTIAAAALKLCSASSAVVTRFDGDLIRVAAMSNVTVEGADAVRGRYPRPPGRYNAAGRAILTRSVVVIPDVLEDPEFEVRPPLIAAGFRSVAAIPLVRGGTALGAITVARPEPGQVPEKQIALLRMFADQAVIAIENVRLFTELDARTTELTRSVQELKALGEVGQAVSSTLDLETVLSTIASRAIQLTGMDGGAIQEYDEAHEEFHLRTTSNLPDELVAALQATPIPKGEGAVGRMATIREPVQFNDIADAGSYRSRVHEILLRYGYRSVLAVPLLREDHLLGGLVVIRKRAGEFAAQVIDLLRTFATQSALAIQNARLYREIELKSRQLETASRHKSEFLANMSHELRTPLNAIIGFSEVLAERIFGEVNEKQAEYINDILQSGQHLLSLINDILDLSKIEAGRMELELSDFDLPSTIDTTLLLVRERAQRHGIGLGREVDERLGIVRGDERKVKQKQVLLNLLSNALKFTPEGGKIDVRAALNDGVAEISVTDTGVGIAPEEQQAVFEEFRQVGAASKKVEGTGLGLAISRKFIELHGGRIWVESTPGSGSTFSFTVPLG